jgi:hypothetical protein
MSHRWTLAPFFAAAALAALAGCGSPCSKHEGTTDGYCNGIVAMNCRSTCADCIDEWKLQACTTKCSVVDAQPTESVLEFEDPHMSQPAKWAVCNAP